MSSVANQVSCARVQGRRVRRRFGSRTAAATAVTVAEAEAQTRPSSSEAAKTLLFMTSHGTLATVCEDGVPLGTHASYVLDERGCPLMRLRADALHTGNVERSPRCSLFVQPSAQPAGVHSRATLIGSAQQLEAEELEEAQALYSELHGEEEGVDAPRDDDRFYRLEVEKVFYVGGLGSDKRAEVVDGEAYCAAEADSLSLEAPSLVQHFNTLADDMVLFASSATDQLAPGETVADARMLWMDRLGFDCRVVTGYGATKDVRVAFGREVTNESAVRSTLTLLAQKLWEQNDGYTPRRPVLPDPEESMEETSMA
mmetsp:Transcript_22840/g.74393  ORF Transcript_22840/g.74393 Transcript_22840/m.74393 type:complete len:313 (-) Transcript_22840:74-1012(-)